MFIGFFPAIFSILIKFRDWSNLQSLLEIIGAHVLLILFLDGVLLVQSVSLFGVRSMKGRRHLNFRFLNSLIHTNASLLQSIFQNQGSNAIFRFINTRFRFWPWFLRFFYRKGCNTLLYTRRNFTIFVYIAMGILWFIVMVDLTNLH